MKLLSLNCHGLPFTNKKQRFEKIAQLINQLEADVVSLQEVIFADDLKYFRGLGYKLVYEVGWFSIIKGGLVMMAKVDSGRSWFRKFKNQGRLLSRQLTDRVLGKGLCVLELESGIVVVNAHLVRVYKNKNTPDKSQGEQIETLIKLIKGKERVIIAGDLNIDEGSKLYQKLTEKVADLTKGMGHSYIKSPEKLDYVMAFPNMAIKMRCFVDELLGQEWQVSDHRGMYVELAETAEF